MLFQSLRTPFMLALPLSVSISGFSWAYDGGYCTDLMNTSLNPLGSYEWHLYAHGGNSAFATAFQENERKAAYGQDINAYPVLKDYCLSGYGVHVAVVDSGMQTAHPSLAPNIDNRPHQSTTWSVNYRKNNLSEFDPSPVDADEEDHGTMVAGIIAMRSNLGVGGSGVAPRAHLAAYNLIHDDTQTFQNVYDSLGGSDASKNNDIFSMSYGADNDSQMPDDEPLSLAARAMYKKGVSTLRNGKGALYVKAAGNGFDELGERSRSCAAAVKYHVSCQDSNMEPDNAMPEVITVAALNVFGKRASYSTTGSSLWVSMPGGEFGFDRSWVDAQFARLRQTVNWDDFAIPKEALFQPAIISTDMMGPNVGAARRVNMDDPNEVFQSRNAFNAGFVPENENYHYTNLMNGTSASTPLTSGAIAVILEANPNLTWRDVKYILAKTSTKVDSDFAGVTANLSRGSYQLEQGWVTNAAGFHFSNWYGFGRVDLQAAVDLALNYDYPLGEYVEGALWPQDKALSLDIPAGNYDGLTRVVNISSGNNLTIESVVLFVSLKSQYVGDTAIELTSPSRTKSIVWHAANGFANNGNLEEMPILTNAFYGERSAGDWKVRVINTGIHSKRATWTSFQMQVTGYRGQ